MSKTQEVVSISRPIRCRKICQYPDYWNFIPEGHDGDSVVELTLDELETIRWIDYEGLSQLECASRLNVARTTVTAIYDRARKKIADSIINGKQLKICGGNYEIDCDTLSTSQMLQQKGNNTMRIAITYENGQVFQHFGHTAQFMMYDIENNTIKDSKILDTQGSGHGALATFLKNNETDVLICGGIGSGAVNALEEAKIKLYAGVSGDVEKTVQAFLDGKLVANSSANCNHHDEHEHGHHSCGDHHGNHECGHGSCHH